MICLSLLSIPLMATFIGFFSPKKYEFIRNTILLIGFVVQLIILIYLFPIVAKGEVITYAVDHVMGIGLFLRIDAFRMIFMLLSTIAWFLVTLYSIEYLKHYERKNRYYLFHMLTYVGTMGMFISDNLLNIFMFFELLSVTSYALIIHDEDQYSHEAGSLYIGMAIGGGLIQLMGLFLLFGQVGSLNLSIIQELPQITTTAWLACILILIGYFVKASVFPFHIWLPKAHPAAPTPASALLSGVLIKTGVFGIIIISEYVLHAELFMSVILVALGLTNALVGGILAIYQRNLKRIMAYSSMSQVGYIVATIGLTGLMGSKGGIAIFSALYHVVSHGFFKVMLFLAVGIIYRELHEVSINNIRGYGRNYPLLLLIFTVGSMAIVGIPGTSGFVSKSFMHDALVEAEHIVHSPMLMLIEMLFTFASCLTVAYTGKIFVEVFVKKPYKIEDYQHERIPMLVILPILLLLTITIFLGTNPIWVNHFLKVSVENIGFTMDHVPEIFDVSHMLYVMVTLIVGALILRYYVMKRLRVSIAGREMYVNPAIHWINLEKVFYRPLMNFVIVTLPKAFNGIDHATVISLEFLRDRYHKLTRTERVESATNRITSMLGEVGIVLLALLIIFTYTILS